jgi:RNA recognition motif-containing protein
MRDAATGKSRGFAFLTFADSRVVDDVASRTHQLDGKNVRYCPNQVVISHLANTLVD